jgi:hypothetical protein
MTENEITEVEAAIRAKIDETGYGGMVPEQFCREMAIAAIKRLDRIRPPPSATSPTGVV